MWEKEKRWPMSMKAHGLEPIPEETRRLIQSLGPKGTMVTQLRDALGPIYSDEPFAHLFPKRGRPAETPWRLAPLSPTETMFEIGKTLTGGKWKNTGVASGEKKVNNWSIVQRPGCGSRDEDHERPS